MIGEGQRRARWASMLCQTVLLHTVHMSCTTALKVWWHSSMQFPYDCWCFILPYSHQQPMYNLVPVFCTTTFCPVYISWSLANMPMVLSPASLPQSHHHAETHHWIDGSSSWLCVLSSYSSEVVVWQFSHFLLYQCCELLSLNSWHSTSSSLPSHPASSFICALMPVHTNARNLRKAMRHWNLEGAVN